MITINTVPKMIIVIINFVIAINIMNILYIAINIIQLLFIIY